MKTKEAISLRGVWALAWRSVVYLPLMLGMFFVLLSVFAVFVLLPIVGTVYLAVGLYTQGLTALALWVPMVWIWIRFRLWRFFQ